MAGSPEAHLYYFRLDRTWGERNAVYRGQIVQTNWWGAESEVGRTISAALDDALLQINFPITTSTCEAPAA